VVESRVLRANRVIGNNWLVTEGVAPGDRVIIEGLQRVRAGIRVQPTERAPARVAS